MRKDASPSENLDSLELTDASRLTDKQSVRATFRLSGEFIDALRALSTQLGIKQKSLFDHLMEDMESLRLIAGRVQPHQLEKKTRIQKTFVISKKSLSSLDEISKRFETSRDDLVEYSIQRLLPILLEEREKQSKREKALNRIAAHFNRANELKNEVMAIVGEEDPIYKTMETVLATFESALDDIESLVNSGKKITDLSMDKFKK